MGTIAYISPELLKESENIDDYFQIEADMWAIGVILFCLISGYHPFDDENNDKLVNQILSCDYDFHPEEVWDCISSECKDLIEKMLEPNVQKRLTPEQALDHCWFKSENKPFYKVNPNLLQRLKNYKK